MPWKIRTVSKRAPPVTSNLRSGGRRTRCRTSCRKNFLRCFLDWAWRRYPMPQKDPLTLQMAIQTVPKEQILRAIHLPQRYRQTHPKGFAVCHLSLVLQQDAILSTDHWWLLQGRILPFLQCQKFRKEQKKCRYRQFHRSGIDPCLYSSEQILQAHRPSCVPNRRKRLHHRVHHSPGANSTAKKTDLLLPVLNFLQPLPVPDESPLPVHFPKIFQKCHPLSERQTPAVPQANSTILP